jgi:hypothetical protein
MEKKTKNNLFALLYFSLIFYSDLARQQDLLVVKLSHQHR